jgi:hypothetical protein
MGPTVSLHADSLDRLLFSNSAVSSRKSIWSLFCLRAIQVRNDRACVADTELQAPLGDLLVSQTVFLLSNAAVK